MNPVLNTVTEGLQVHIERLGSTAQPLVQGLQLQVPPGEILTLMGPSGCGKSSVLAAIAGTLASVSEGLQPLQLQGSVQLNGRELSHLPTHQRGVGLVFQDALLFPHMTVTENLLFADPLLTAHSAFAVGDPRRPQDVVLLSPILTRWGLELTFAEDQPEGLRVVPGPGPAIPVNLRGGWRASAEGCQVEAEGLVATCRIGRGHVVAVADAEVLTDADPDAIRGPALAALLRRAFANH